MTLSMILSIAAFAETVTGLLALVCPSVLIRLLFGGETGGTGVIVCRFTGIALVGLSIACWPGKKSGQTSYGMLTYSTLAMLYLAFLGISGTGGVLLWPAVVAHALLSALILRALLLQTKRELSKGADSV